MIIKIGDLLGKVPLKETEIYMYRYIPKSYAQNKLIKCLELSSGGTKGGI